MTASQLGTQSITTPCSRVQLFASVTTTVCVPIGRFVAVCVV